MKHLFAFIALAIALTQNAFAQSSEKSPVDEIIVITKKPTSILATLIE